MSPFVSLHLSPVAPSLDAWHGSLGGRIHLSPLSPFICVLLSWHGFVPRCLSGSLGHAWRGSLGGRVHLSLNFILSPVVSGRVRLSCFVTLHLFPVVSQHGYLDGFICLPCLPSCTLSPLLSPFITALWCLPLSPSLDAWHGSLDERIHLSRLPLSADSFVSLLHLLLRMRLPLSPFWVDGLSLRAVPDIQAGRHWATDNTGEVMPGTAPKRASNTVCLPSFASADGCLARLFGFLIVLEAASPATMLLNL